MRKLRGTALLGVLALASIGATLMVTAASAAARPVTFEWVFKNVETGRCLGWDDGERVYSAPCKRLADTTWKVSTWRDGTYQLRPKYHPGRCLDDSRFGLRTFQPCWPGRSPLSRFQSWDWRYNGDGYSKAWQNWFNQETENCLDDSRLGLRMFPCNRSRFQSWETIPPYEL